MTREKQLCTFVLDSFLMGIEVEDVREVMRNQPITMVPMAPKEIRGLINLRGQIVPVVDLRCRLELSDCDADRVPVLMIVEPDAQTVGLLVDRVEDVIDVAEEDCEPPPGTLQGIGRELIRSAYKLPDRLLLVLDVRRVVDVDAVPVCS